MSLRDIGRTTTVEGPLSERCAISKRKALTFSIAVTRPRMPMRASSRDIDSNARCRMSRPTLGSHSASVSTRRLWIAGDDSVLSDRLDLEVVLFTSREAEEVPRQQEVHNTAPAVDEKHALPRHAGDHTVPILRRIFWTVNRLTAVASHERGKGLHALGRGQTVLQAKISYAV